MYPQIWEDPAVDLEALAIQPGENLVSIASGSCNVMSYLTAKPGSITVVDLSPAHVALGRLKLAAVQNVPDHATFYDFFGRANLASNRAVYKDHIAPNLDRETRAFWDKRRVTGQRQIARFSKGFYRAGLLGRFIGTVHALAWIARIDLKAFLKCETLDEQRAFYERHIDPLFDRRIVKFLARHRASLFGLGIPPAQYEKLADDGDGDVVPVLRERTRKLFCDFPLSENYFAWQAVNRGYRDDGTGPFPPYLDPKNFETVRKHADRVTVHNRSLTDALAMAESGSKHGYVFLDAQDWMTDAQLNALWGEVTRTAAPGARVVFRTGGEPDILPGRVADDILNQWRYDAEASERGTANDRSAIYGGFHLYVKTAD